MGSSPGSSDSPPGCRGARMSLNVVLSLHIAQHTTLQITRENYERFLIKCLFLLSYLRQCAFTANPKEITVNNNFTSTFDNADNSS